MLSYEEIMALRHVSRHQWRDTDAMLYAVGIGLPSDPLCESELDFVYEKRGPKVFPTFPVVVGFRGGVLEQIGFDYLKILHGEHAVTLSRPFPASGEAIGESRIVGVWDKGSEKGAVFRQEKTLTLVGETKPIASILTTTFARGDGGYGGPREGQPAPHQVPNRAPDRSIDFATLPNQALIYRLSGDDHPLHADPAVAKAAGFPGPVLHGLCTYAICCRAVLEVYCDNDPARVRHHAVRFSAPVFPGDVVSIDLWRDGDVVSCEARVKARDAVVIRNGMTLLA
jgi:acyl dehydratase